MRPAAASSFPLEAASFFLAAGLCIQGRKVADQSLYHHLLYLFQKTRRSKLTPLDVPHPATYTAVYIPLHK